MTDKKEDIPVEDEEKDEASTDKPEASKESPQEGKKYDGGAIPR